MRLSPQKNLRLLYSTQRGAALMVMLVIVVVGITAVLLNSLNASSLKSARQATTAAALAQAKDALIGYAITFGDTHSAVHGYLLCPDKVGGNPEGSAEASCGSKDVSVIGRLPWRTLDLSTQRDGDGECLWYAVSGTYKNNPKTDLMNWDNNGQFDILNASGVVVAQNAVAIVFSPGVVLGNQNRAPDGTAPICGGNYTAANYLDSDGTINNAVVSSGVKATSQFRLASSSQINDQMIFITQQDIWNAIQKRTDFKITLQLLTQRIAECLMSYGNSNSSSNNKSLPWPASRVLADYGSNSNYSDTQNLYAGRIPYQVDDSKAASGIIMTGNLLIVGEPPIGDPPYPPNGLTCPAYAATPTTELQKLYPWWKNWKDHLFYALSSNFEPINGSTGGCGGNCITVNGISYAAVVMLAGKKLSALNQTRADKSVAADYLEGGNASHFAAANPPTNGDENYVSAVSSTFNDILFCITDGITPTVIPCP